MSSKDTVARGRSLGDLRALPLPTLIRLFQFLEPRELLACSLVSWAFHGLHDLPQLWKTLALLYFVSSPDANPRKRASFCYHGTWKITVLHPARYAGKPWWEQVKNRAMTVLPVSHIRPRWATVPMKEEARWYDVRAVNLYSLPMYLTGVDRRENLSPDDFWREYDAPNRPVVMVGAANHMAARQKWTLQHMAEHYGEVPLRSNGRSTNGRRYRIKLFDYLAYAAQSNAEKPMYCFDKKVLHADEDEHFCAELLQDYEVLPHFQEDLFKLMDEDDRPDYRWVLIGPHGSGTPFHTDPHGTSAWNAVFDGCKRVSFYPPDVIPPGVDEELIHSDYYAADDMMDWYRNTAPSLPPHRRPMECLVRPGDIVFIPSGWWHSVMNIGTTIAVTQNYVSRRTWPRVRDEINQWAGKGLRRDFKCALAEGPPETRALADEIHVKKQRA